MSASSRELEANPETQNGSILEQTAAQGSRERERERFTEGNKSGKGKNLVKTQENQALRKCLHSEESRKTGQPRRRGSDREDEVLGSEAAREARKQPLAQLFLKKSLGWFEPRLCWNPLGTFLVWLICHKQPKEYLFPGYLHKMTYLPNYICFTLLTILGKLFTDPLFDPLLDLSCWRETGAAE